MASMMPKTNLDSVLRDLRELDQNQVERTIKKSLAKATRDELIKLASATEHLAKPTESKFGLYKPVSQVARAFHRSSAMIRLLLGGNRASKTTTATMDNIIRSTKSVPTSLSGEIPQKYLIPGPTFTRIVATDFPDGIEKVVKPKIWEWSPPDTIVDYSAEFRIFSYRDGSKLDFMTYDQDKEKHGGVSRHRVQFDEEPPEILYDEALMRILDTEGELVLAMTPVNGMTWVYDKIFLKAGRRVYLTDEGGERKFVDQEIEDGDKNIEVFILSTFDNPHLKKSVITTIEGKLEDEEERKIRLGGEFVSFSGLIYKQYSSKIHDIDPFHIPNLQDWETSKGKTAPWPVYTALDPHPRVPHAYLMCAVDPHGRKFFFEEFFEGLDVDPLASRIKLIEKHYWVIWRLIDASAQIQDPVANTCLLEALRDRNLVFQIGPKDLVNGITRVREGLGVKEREGNTGRVKMPEIYFFKNLKRTKWEIVRYVWDEWRRVRDERTPKARPRDKDDHMMENLYRIMLREPVWVDYEEETKPLGEWRHCP